MKNESTIRRAAPGMLFCALAAVWLGFGCASPPRHDEGPYLPQKVSVNDLENRTAFVLLSREVQYTITCPGIQEMRLPSGQLQVAVNLRNREERRVQVQANCEFKDPQGFVVDSTPYQTVMFDENSQQSVKFVSMNDKAVGYTIRVREVH